MKIIIIALLLVSYSVHAARNHHEKWYQEQWCQEHNGKMEVQMKDSTRCDCVTETHAIEMDFADKWYESVGQSTNYSIQTGKRAGIVLILESKKDQKYWKQLTSLINKASLPIDMWAVGEGVSSEMTYEETNYQQGNTCKELPTLKMEEIDSSIKWSVHIPCLVDKTGIFGEIPMWVDFSSKGNKDGNFIFNLDEYGYTVSEQ